MTKKIKEPKQTINKSMPAPSIPNKMPSLPADIFSTQISVHTGPLPNPVTLQEYEKVMPGLAERIVLLVENEQKHKHKIDDDVMSLNKDVINIESKERRLGQIFGIIIGLAGLIASVICASFQAQTTASIIGGTTVVGLVTVFVIGKKLKDSTQTKE
ncbi:DUF2335 domain-containing protein [Candidatus Magnetomonas plexicatena]|uniref:DUF2335 domain-containing protein n=1 Tax=Candidatus Magnetomonas plexicatena TaxID=2552947 RepID=UPI001C7818E1|nr:DUF2335 domain-containing protein [Nitrospirales bacterium LBB_01]